MEEEGFPEEEEERRGLEINTSQNRQKTFHIVHPSIIRHKPQILFIKLISVGESFLIPPPPTPPPALILNASSAG